MTMLPIPLLLKGSIAVSSPFAPTVVLQVCYSNVKHKDGIFQTMSGTCHTHAQHEKWSLSLLFNSRVVYLQYKVQELYVFVEYVVLQPLHSTSLWTFPSSTPLFPLPPICPQGSPLGMKSVCLQTR